MKKIMLVALSMVVAGMVFAHGGYYRNAPRQGGEFWRDMGTTHDIMHNTSIKESQTDKGLMFEITAESESVEASIKKRFLDGQAALKEFFRGVDVTVEALENGARITFNSEDENIRKRLQESRKGLIYQYVHAGFGGSRGGRGYHCGGYGSGPGAMHGSDHHRW